jgi:ATP-binding protein involved in chromosome partitioning
MATITRDAILGSLGSIQAPGTDENIVAMGYVKDVKTEGDAVSLTVSFPGPLTPARRAVADACKAAIAESTGDARVEVQLEAKIPASFVGDGGLVPGVKNIIAVGSGKGGVGKSTVSVNLAVGLAKAGARVGLLDTDVYGPSVPLLLGVTQQAFMERLHLEAPAGGAKGQPPQLKPYVAHGVGSLSLGYLVDPDKAAIWRGPMVHGAVLQLLRDCEWGELDYLVVDLPPGTGDVQLSLSQNVTIGGAVVVCTPQPVAIADARKAVQMLGMTKTPVLGMVENMGYHACPSCGHEDDIFGARGAQDAAQEWEIPFLGSLPLDTRVRISGDKGVPLLADDDAPEALAAPFWSVVDRVTAELAARARSRPRSLPITRS